jgi:ribose transport system substrate-binding protein
MKKIALILLLIPLLMATTPQVSKTLGPNGESPVNSRSIGFGSNDKATLQNKKLKAAILMHTESDFVNAVVMGAKDRFDLFNVELSLIRFAHYDALKQEKDIKDAINLGVDIIVILVIDPKSGGEALKKAVDKGVKIALLSNLPEGFIHFTDYASIVTDDLYSMGHSLAKMMGDDLKGQGNVIWLYHNADYYVTNQRDWAFKNSIDELYPEITITHKVGVSNPQESRRVVDNLLKKDTDIDAIYAPWDEIAKGVIEALKENDLEGIDIYTMDLGSYVSVDMAKGGYVKGIVADLPYSIGGTLADVSCLSVLGRYTPPFIIVPSISVTRDNLEQMWQRAYRIKAPNDVIEALNP